MPIIGITDREERFPEIGQVRKGSPKTENAPGRDLDYFRVEFDERETEAKQKFTAIYGDKPQQLNIMLAFDEVDSVWDAYLEAYTAGRLVARSDGKQFLYLVDVKTGEILVKNSQPYREYKEGEPVGYWKNVKTNKDEPIYLKPVGRLRVVIPELKRLAYLTVLTTSIHDIVNLSSQIKGLAAVNGKKIAGIPLILCRKPKKVSTPKADGSRVRYTKWLLSIEASPAWVGAKLDNMAQLSMPETATAYLPAGEPVKPEIQNHQEKPDPSFDDTNEDDDNWVPPSEEDYQDGEFQEIPANPEPVHASESKQTPKKITVNDFWTEIKTNQKKDQAYGKQLLEKNGGDFEAAYYEARKANKNQPSLIPA